MTTVTIDRNILKGLSRLAAKKDVRHSLNGVCFETGPKGSFVIATDGHVLGAYRTSAEPAGDETTRFIVKLEDIDRVPKKGDGEITFTLIDRRTDWRTADLHDEANNMTLHVDLIDGRYPDWPAVLPVKVSERAGHFDPELLHRFAMVAKDFGRKAKPLFRLQHNGPNGAALVTIDGQPEFLGVIMPVRMGPFEAPAWHDVTVEPYPEPAKQEN